MINLLDETINVLAQHGKTLNDIKWVGLDGGNIGLAQFINFANVDYDNGYGAAEVPLDLMVAGDGWWLERVEYDGAEWWEFKAQPLEPDNFIEIDRLVW